ncbi:MAG: M48 family metalloprotease [Acidobacteria bacterium]|nr:M48 family metalloprotease [Acidobacteriota bacterium]
MAARVRRLAVVSLILGAGAVSVSAQKPKDDVNRIGSRKVGNCINFYSFEKEMALGKQLAREVQKQAKLVDDPLITEYVNRLGQNLVRSSDAKIPFSFQIVEGDAPNAFALPGGYVFVYTGLMKIASEEDELAAAMAHEIAHVAARHMTCQATKSELAGIAGMPASVLLGGWGGYAARQAAGLALPAAFLHLSRKDESEADYLGVQYMYAAGYDPNGAISVFEKIESLNRRQPGVVDRVFSTHPMDADRIAKTEREIARILPDKPQYVVTTSEYASIRDRLIDQQALHKTEDASRPALHRATGRPGTSTGDDRPTIKRRDLIY